jgi:hypothetical protein
VPAMASIFTGLSPLKHRASYGKRYVPEIASIQVRLGEAGYGTHARVSYNGFLKADSGSFHVGFDSYAWGAEAVAPKNLEKVMDLYSEAPFYFWLHLFDPHMPYRSPEETRDLFGGNKELDKIRRGFIAKTKQERAYIRRS